MKANSDIRPEPIQVLGKIIQVRWNIEKTTKTDNEGNSRDSYNYEYANCDSNSYADLVSGIIRSRYTTDETEAIIANFAKRKNIVEYLKFQAFRNLAKAVASNKIVEKQIIIKLTMPLSYALSGGRYEVLSDRVLKIGSPYEIYKKEDGTEMVIVYLNSILSEHAAIVGTDPDLIIEQIDLLNEEI